MENAQKELLAVLLGRVLSRGLISKATCQNALDSLHAVKHMPELLQYPARSTRGATTDECAQNTV